MSDWQDRAACRGMTDVFFSDAEKPRAQARLICSDCPVFAECEEAGRSEEHGIWAGKTPGQRSGRPRKLREPVETVCVMCSGRFWTRSGGLALYCSDRCRNFAHNVQRRQARKAS